ncbi:hypothetical protein ADUPG1_008890 [Aduncisulcus paluster]|uniref:CCHC-type domain-containing protein n=1 Tax=Aduncisulcus paluster TaxID=2918883 RepID=A0ABQ5KTK4_9EUKA|nr:hypothetical protein ADUPG1_008890 [Aduncisulcus paluster]
MTAPYPSWDASVVTVPAAILFGHMLLGSFSSSSHRLRSFLASADISSLVFPFDLALFSSPSIPFVNTAANGKILLKNNRCPTICFTPSLVHLTSDRFLSSNPLRALKLIRFNNGFFEDCSLTDAAVTGCSTSASSGSSCSSSSCSSGSASSCSESCCLLVCLAISTAHACLNVNKAYRALGGKTPLFALVNADTRLIYEDVVESSLPNPVNLPDEEAIAKVTEDAIAGYVKRYRSALRRLDKDEVLTEETICKYFLRGIEHRAFKTRMEATLQKQEFTLANFTRVIFSQLLIVKESREDAAHYEVLPDRPRNQSKHFSKKGMHSDSSSRSFEKERKKFSDRRTNTDWKKEIVCFNCGQKGHFASECPRKKHDHEGSGGKRRSAKAVITKNTSSLPSKAASPSEENFISFKVVDRLQQNQSIKSGSVPISLELADGSNLDLQKKVKLKAEFPELPGRKALCFAFSAYVMPMRAASSHDLVVGFPLIQELDLFGYMRTHPSLQHKTIEDVSWELEELDHRRFIRKDELCTYHEVHISCEFQDELTKVLSVLLGKFAVEGGKKIPPMNIELKEGADFTLSTSSNYTARIELRDPSTNISESSKCLLDTGTSVSTISHKLLKRLGSDINTDNIVTFELADGSVKETIGSVTLEVIVEGIKKKHLDQIFIK